MRIFARKRRIFDQYCNGTYLNYNIANAVHGFHEMGFEIIDYNLVQEVYDEYEKGDILLDGISQVDYVLSKFGIVPQNIDYPEALKPFLGRRIWRSTINQINADPESWPVFVKSLNDKVITGKLIRSPKDLVGCGCSCTNEEIFCSQPVDFIYECRGFMYYDNLIDLRPYKGNYIHMNKMDTAVIKKAVEAFKHQKDRPNACSLDFGVTSDNRTLFIEQNAAYSLGCYGLPAFAYAKLISACISQLSGTKDECRYEMK